MMAAFGTGDFAGAADAADSFLEDASGSGDEIMWQLEAGTLALLLKEYDKSIAHFDRAETLIEDFDQRAEVSLRQAGAESAVLLTNMNALPYRGWCRDRIMLPVFRALAYLGKEDQEGFRTEIFHLRGNQQKVMDDYSAMFREEEEALRKEKEKNQEAAANADPDKILDEPSNQALRDSLRKTGGRGKRGVSADLLNPLGIFLSGYGYCRDGDWENALVDFERLLRLYPRNRMIRRHYATVARLAGRSDLPEWTEKEQLAFTPGERSLLVIFANGRGAAFKQSSLYLPIVFSDYAGLSAIAWPMCEYYDRPAGALSLSWQGGSARTAPLADMDDSLAREYRMRLPGLITRVALSTAVKEAAAYAIARAAREMDEWAAIAAEVGTSVYKAAVNTADTRCWETLPGEFQAMEIPMPRDGKVTVRFGEALSETVTVPEGAESAILFLYAPGNGVLHSQIFSLEKGK